jgi:hypothetical protein
MEILLFQGCLPFIPRPPAVCIQIFNETSEDEIIRGESIFLGNIMKKSRNCFIVMYPVFYNSISIKDFHILRSNDKEIDC